MRSWIKSAAILVTVLAILNVPGACAAEVIRRAAKDTLTAVEMEHGDQLRFRLREGRTVSLALVDTDAAIVEEVKPGGIVYRFSAEFQIDGQPIRLQRYVCSQECFYEPWVVNGLRIWLDTVRDVFDLVPVRYPRKGNLRCVPRKAARIAVQDAALRICPETVHLWIDREAPTLDVGACYNGDDCYLGPYLGRACHVGMDINHPKGSPLFAPIRFDTQAYFNSLAMGHNNNRWRGIRRWPNGDVWALQSHHLIELLVPQETPLEAGAKYATTAGVHVGSHQHTHFEFKIGRPQHEAIEEPGSIAEPIDFDDESPLAQQQPEVLHLDPWIVFWQALEDRKECRGGIRAAIAPLGPARTGEEVRLAAVGSSPAAGGKKVTYRWFIGETGMVQGPSVTHAFPRPGVFPVRLIVDDGTQRDSTLQWITVSGAATEKPSLILKSPEEPSFRALPAGATDVYGGSAVVRRCTLRFLARSTRPQPRAKEVVLVNRGEGCLPESWRTEIAYDGPKGWLRADCVEEQNQRKIVVQPDASGLEPAKYTATVEVRGLEPVRRFQVELLIPSQPPRSDAVVDDADPGFYATPYFWVGHRFCRCPADRRGYGGFYLTNGGRPAAGEFARFTPDLEAGTYKVSLSDKTAFSVGLEFNVRVLHAKGEEIVRLKPDEGRTIGTFEFEEGADGFVEILGEDSKGLVIADAVRFQKQ